MYTARDYQLLCAFDFDGTLTDTQGQVPPAAVEAFEHLGTKECCRVIVTGRSLYSLKRGLPEALRPDYAILSTGGSIYKWPPTAPLKTHHLANAELERTRALLDDVQVDYCVQGEFPANHYFAAVGAPHCKDFLRRCAFYDRFQLPLRAIRRASQVLAIAPRVRGLELLPELRAALQGLTVIRTTSPLDGQSIWIEIFPHSVSKAQSTAWLAQHLGLPRQACVAIGNDYNDEDLLGWASHSWVVQNAPAALRQRFDSLPSSDEAGVRELWSKLQAVFPQLT